MERDQTNCASVTSQLLLAATLVAVLLLFPHILSHTDDDLSAACLNLIKAKAVRYGLYDARGTKDIATLAGVRECAFVRV